MTTSDMPQQGPFQNWQQRPQNLQQIVQALLQQQSQQQPGFAQPGFGQAAYGFGGAGGHGNSGQHWGGQQRQITQQDVANVIQQLAPILPQLISQAQQQQSQQPLGAFGGGSQRNLSQQDVSEVVRQIIPLLPHILQSSQQGGNQQGPWQSGFGGQNGFGGQGQAAYDNGYQQNQQRGPTQQDVNEIARQLAEAVVQATAQQRGFC